ncbi:hypothetical protein MMC17_001490 [Xylographa soralifera]|nr:hypothetical protein [Xylographa soralifera]
MQQYGGLGFGPLGEYVSAPISILDAGPFSTYEDLVKATVQSKLVQADTDSQVEGWRANGVRARLDKFIEEGFHAVMENMGSFPKASPLRISLYSNANLNQAPDNFLYEKSTLRLTALLDFDFSHIATFEDEFFRSFGHNIGQLPSLRGSGELLALRKAMLTDFADPLTPV